MSHKVYNEILGKTIEIPDNPRIISLAPSITDSLYQVGAWEYVVGVSAYCNIPKEAAKKPRVGTYMNVIYKRIDELDPDIIFTTTGIQRRLSEELDSRGYPVYPIPLPISIYGILENMYIIGGVVGKISETNKRMEYYFNKLAEIRREVHLRVYYEVDLGEPITIGGISYINSGLYHVGLKNIFLKELKTYFTPNFNTVKDLNPDIIIYEMHHGKSTNMEKLLETFYDRGWGEINAIIERKIYILKPDSLAHYGPTFIDNLATLADKIFK